MSYEMLVGLNVLDDVKYEEYRSAMKPILADYQGYFGYDFKVSEVLISPDNAAINRVFTLNFSNKGQMEGFFSDPQYLVVKEQFFIASVGNVSIISSYDKAD